MHWLEVMRYGDDEPQVINLAQVKRIENQGGTAVFYFDSDESTGNEITVTAPYTEVVTCVRNMMSMGHMFLSTLK
jgi:hypothetical protein